jgi:hypothetical protein
MVDLIFIIKLEFNKILIFKNFISDLALIFATLKIIYQIYHKINLFYFILISDIA